MSGSTCVSLAPSSVVAAPPAWAAEETHSDGMITIQSDEAPMILSKPRAVVQTLTCQRRPLGDGFAYRRSIGGPELESLDPIISFDDFEFTGPANFGDHPHRGFESLTYVLEGSIGFHDFSGHKGTINTGDAQWTTVGRGVVHAEVPAGQGVQRGLNFWINLAAKDKMDATGAFAARSNAAWWWLRGKNCSPNSAEVEGGGDADSGLVDGGRGMTALASTSLWWWDSLSGSSMEVTAAKAATAMAERGRWRGGEKKAITA